MIKCNKRHRGWDYQRYGNLRQDCVLDVTLETRDHVGTVFDGLFARNTVTCWVVNSVYVQNAPGLPGMAWVRIMEVDPAPTTERDMTRFGGRMSLRSTCHPTTSENGMQMSVKSQASRRMSLPDEAEEKCRTSSGDASNGTVFFNTNIGCHGAKTRCRSPDLTPHKPHRVAPTDHQPRHRGGGVHPHRVKGIHADREPPRTPHNPPRHPNRQGTTPATARATRQTQRHGGRRGKGTQPRHQGQGGIPGDRGRGREGTQHT